MSVYNLEGGASVRAKINNAIDRAVDVRDYASAGSDSAALQLAIDTGRDVCVPRGTTLNIDATCSLAGQKVFGGGTLVQAADNINILDVSGGGVVEGLRLSGSGGGSETNKNCGVYADGGANQVVRDCEIHGFAICGVQFRNTSHTEVTNNYFHSNLFRWPTGSDILFYSNTGGRGARIIGNRCVSNNSQAIYINALGNDYDFFIDGNYGDLSGLSVTADAPGTYENSATILQRRHAIVFGYNGGAGGGVISNNVFRGTLWSGFYRNGSSLPQPVKIVDNVISHASLGTGDGGLNGGILLISAAENDLIEGNSISAEPAMKITNTYHQGASVKSSGNTYDGTVLLTNLPLKKFSSKLDSFSDFTITVNSVGATCWTQIEQAEFSGLLNADLGTVTAHRLIVKSSDFRASGRAIFGRNWSGSYVALAGNVFYGCAEGVWYHNYLEAEHPNIVLRGNDFVGVGEPYNFGSTNPAAGTYVVIDGGYSDGTLIFNRGGFACAALGQVRGPSLVEY